MSTSIEVRFAKRLRDLRKKHKITQEYLAGISGVDYKHIQRLESKNPPAVRINTLEKIAKAFNISVSKLLDF